MKTLTKLTISLITMLCTPLAHASDALGAQLSLLWGIPFAGILLSIAFCPLFIPQVWHQHYGKITFGWVLLFLLPYTACFGSLSALSVVSHALFTEYVPFILLLLALFIVSGGILIKGDLRGTPKVNTLMLLVGTLLASIMGTTGAAMLLIRPLIKANQQRKNKVHIIVFFIFLVANIGGGLTPLGDPPLFLGFLNGIDFLWVTKHMFLPVVFCSLMLLTLFFIIDCYYFRRETASHTTPKSNDSIRIRLQGKGNIVLLIAIIASVLLSGVWQSTISITVLGTELFLPNLVRDGLLLLIGLISIMITSEQIRQDNQFNWEPILEVGKLFAGIFVTIFPVLAILRAGNDGGLSSLTSLVINEKGEPINIMYFWLTGLLSAFLDNAPTYLVFFNLADGRAEFLMGPLSQTLLAISMGSVFMGALTYIGNAPNFMIRSIAVQQNIKMPSFFGYIKWSFLILLPIFLLLTSLFV